MVCGHVRGGDYRRHRLTRSAADFCGSWRCDHHRSGSAAGEDPATPRPIKPFSNYSSHDEWGTDHFGFLYAGDLRAFCNELRAKGVKFPVELKDGPKGSLLCYVSAPDGVSIELMSC